MIEFKVLQAELDDLESTTPNFDVILDALTHHPEIDMVVEKEGQPDCFAT